MMRRIKRPSFKFSLGVLLFVVTLITGLGVSVINFYDARKTIGNLSGQVFGEASSRVFTLIKSNLDKAQQLGLLNERMLRKFIFDDKNIRDYLYNTLSNFPEFTYLSLANEEGTLIGADYLSKELKVRQWTQVGPQNSQVVEYHAKDKKLVPISTKQDTYDPRVRGWYRTAREKGHPVWIDPYLWLPEKIPGITFAIPSRNGESEIDRVLTVDFQLDFISEALRKFNRYKTGVIFIVNEEGLLIAHNKLGIPGMIAEGESSLPCMEQLRDDHSRTAYQNWSKDKGSEVTEYFWNGQKYFLRSMHLNISENVSWYMIMSISEMENLSEAMAALYRSIGLSLMILLVIIVIGLIINHYITKNFNHIFAEMRNIFQFSFEQTPHRPSFIYEIDKLSAYISNIKSSLVSFKKYLSPILVKKYLLEGMEAKLGGAEKEVTVLFVDIEQYTQISESYSKEELIALLDDFSMIITKNIESFHGTVDKFIGDSIMAFWGGIGEAEDHALLACQCALNCYREIKNSELNINIRIGINTGMVVMGNFGSQERFNFTVLGDNVNQASRLESSNKIYQTSILISEATFCEVEGKILARKVDRVILKGKNRATTIYEIFPQEEGGKGEEGEIKELYEKAFAQYQKKRWQAAIELLDRILAIRAVDGPSLVLKKRCQFYQENPPGDDWDGVFPLTIILDCSSIWHLCKYYL